MWIEIQTLAFDAGRGGFDTAPLDALQAQRHVLTFDEHLFQAAGRPWLCCVITCADSARTEPESADIAVTHREPATAADGPPSSNGTAPAEPEPVDQTTYEALRAWRLEHAKEAGVPPYVVLTNRQLADVVRARPASKAALGRIRGLGSKKIERFGAALLDALRAAVSTEPPVPTAAAATDDAERDQEGAA